MPMFKLKSPDVFPAEFHRALREAGMRVTLRKPEFRQVIYQGLAAKTDALREQRRFMAFKTMLRAHPLHPLYPLLDSLTIRMLISQEANGWSLTLCARMGVKWETAVTSALGM